MGIFSKVVLKVWKFFTLLRVTIVLLISLALVSVLGTVVEQGKSAQEYISVYGEKVYYWLTVIGITDMYHTWWFTTLLSLLALNIIICTIDRFPSKWRSVSHQKTDVSLRFIDNLSNHGAIEGVKARPAEVKEKVINILKKNRYKYEVSDRGEEITVMAYKGKWARFGSDVAHVSLIIILLGSIFGGIWGFKDFQPIYVGETRAIPNTDFKIKVNKFWIDYYDSGQIKQFNSDLSVIENGKEMLRKTIYVNEPLYYKGVRFYQSSYGLAWGKVKKAQFVLVDKETKKQIGAPIFINWNEKIKVAGADDYEVKLVGFVSDFAFDEKNKVVYTNSSEHDNPAVRIELYKNGKLISKPWLFLNFPGLFPVMDDASKSDLILTNYQPIQYTGLQIGKDPGVNVVWFGSIFLGIGFILAFFMFYKRLWINIKSCSDTVDIHIGGMINKNRIIFEREFNALVDKFRDGLIE